MFRYCILAAAHAGLFASALVSLVSIFYITTATRGVFLFVCFLVHLKSKWKRVFPMTLWVLHTYNILVMNIPTKVMHLSQLITA